MKAPLPLFCSFIVILVCSFIVILVCIVIISQTSCVLDLLGVSFVQDHEKRLV